MANYIVVSLPADSDEPSFRLVSAQDEEDARGQHEALYPGDEVTWVLNTEVKT